MEQQRLTPPLETPEPAGDPPAPAMIGFTARFGRYFALVAANIVFSIPTLGFYRFWGKTNIRRYLWASTRLLDEPLEYTGKPSELLIGFLIVLVFLVPLGFLQNGTDFLLQGSHWRIQAAVQGIYFLVFLLLIQVALYRMWRYRLTRTNWRGVRFGLDGSTWEFIKLSFAWTLLSVVSVGFAYPYMRCALLAYRVRNARFGASKLDFKPQPKALMGTWLLVVIPLILMVALWAVIAVEILPVIRGPDGLGPETVTQLGFSWALASPLLLPWAGVAFTLYRHRELVHFAAATRMQEAALHSSAKKSRFLGFLGLYLLAFAAVLVVFFGGFFGVGRPAPAAGMMIFLPIAGLLTLSFLFMSIRFFVLRYILGTLSISHPRVLERAAQSAAEDPAYGEGLADAFDVGAF